MNNCIICNHNLVPEVKFNKNKYLLSCPQCLLKTLYPYPLRDQLLKFYNHKDYFTRNLAQLHDDLKLDYYKNSPIIKLYLKHLNKILQYKSPPANLLEIGCARGVFLDLARKHNYQISGLEINNYAARYAKKYFNLKVIQKPIESLISNKKYDIIVALDLIEHLLDPKNFIKKLNSLLNPRGIVLIGTPNSQSIIYYIAKHLAQKFQYYYPLYRFLGQGKEHLFIFNQNNLSKLLQLSGFQIINIYKYNIPINNICKINNLEKMVLKLLMLNPYEIALIAQKKSS